MSQPDEEQLTPALVLPVDEAMVLLRDGELTIEGRLLDASNATLYCSVACDGIAAACVYKPVAGERPLWDFPDGTLAEREVAAYELSAVTGWAIVPPTIYRDGPLGPGMVQLWIETDDSVDLVSLVRRRTSEQIRRITVLDSVINNADRKGGHLLPVPGGHVYGVDHGISFHAQPKLRTLLWQWSGEPLTDEAVDVLSTLREALNDDLGARLQELLTTREVRRTVGRVDQLLQSRTHPQPPPNRPAIPWPPM